MKNVLKSSFTWQFAGGFVLGAIGLFTLQPASASAFAQHFHQHPISAAAR